MFVAPEGKQGRGAATPSSSTTRPTTDWLFDQRGSVDDTSLTTPPTTLCRTWRCFGPILGIDRWLVFGNSWGSTLGLVYGQRHPERVSEFVLLAVTTTDSEEIQWLYHGAGSLFPDAWERFHASAGVSGRDDDLVSAYYRLLNRILSPGASRY